MTRLTTSLTAAALLTVLAGALAAQQPATASSIDALMGAAMHQQDVENNPQAAAAIYQTVLTDRRASRAVQAKALMQLARINEKLAKPDARIYYERLLSEFSEQSALVSEARTRLAALSVAGAQGPADSATEPAARKVLSRNAPLWSVSPDGRYLTFGHLNNAFIRDSRSGAERQLTRGGLFLTKEEPEFPADVKFSRDARQLAYGWRRSAGYQLRVIAFDGTDERTITNNPEHNWIGPVDWSGDASRVLVKINARGDVGQIAWVSLADGAIQVLKTVPWAALGRIALSPDGRFIAFDQRNDGASGARTIFVLSTDGSKQVAVTEGAARDEVVGWLPDGSGLTFVTYRSGAPALWVQPWSRGQASGIAKVVKRSVGAIEPLGFARDGSLFYRQQTITGHAYIASIDWDAGRVFEPKRINTNLVADGGTAWSPDGSHVAYIAHRSTDVRRRFVAVHALKDGSTREVVPAGDVVMQMTGGHKWSPDGTSYLFNGGSDARSSTTYAMDMPSGALRTLLNFTNAYAQIPQWVNGGRSLLTLVRDQMKPAAEVFIYDLESGQRQPFRHGFEAMRVGGFRASPDERTVAFIVASSSEPPNVIRVMPFSGGAPRTLVEVAPGLALWPMAWTPDSRRLVYSASDRSRNQAGTPRQPFEPQETQVWVVSADGGAPRRLLFPHVPGSLDIHPDGRRVTYGVSDSETEVWALDRLVSANAPSRNRD